MHQFGASVADEKELFSQWLRTPSLVEFSRQLIQGVDDQPRAELDQEIAAAAQNWSVPRMAATDRNLLRLGAYEMHFTDTPAKVVYRRSRRVGQVFRRRPVGCSSLTESSIN